jgi:predicted AlkP superfamily pyrophosphatase or phosphodiesterase
MAKVILIVSDGLRDDTAADQMGYLEHLVESQQASRYTVVSELPTLSRPLYETLHTGLTVSQHGITSNGSVRRSTSPNVFQIAREHGKVTAAASYYWFSELYNRAPFHPIDDREVDDPNLNIQHGRFYMDDSLPDRELLMTAASLVRKFSPDYLLVHPSGMDFIGETFGADTKLYRKQAQMEDQILAYLMPEWLQAGYTVLVTGDHGITDDGTHNGTENSVRHVPLYIIRTDIPGRGDIQSTVSQLQIAPTLCVLLGLPIPETMSRPWIVPR